MGLSSILKLECDYKDCKKVFMVPDPPAKPTPGTEGTWQCMNGMGEKFSFCSPVHCAAFMMDYAKATPSAEPKKPRKRPAKGAVPNVAPTDLQIEKLKALGVIQPTTTQTVPSEPENLRLTEEEI